MSGRGRRNILTGQVISDKMDKTISVLIYNLVKHPKYKKYIKKTSVFKAHDEHNKAKKGDKVRIFETKPVSKTKRWKLLELLDSGFDQEEDIANPLEEIKATKEKSKGDRDQDIAGYGSDSMSKSKQMKGNQEDLVDRMEGNFSEEEIQSIKQRNIKKDMQEIKRDES